MEGNISFAEKEQLNQLYNFYGEKGNLYKAGLQRLFDAIKYTPSEDQKTYIDGIYSKREFMTFEGTRLYRLLEVFFVKAKGH